MVGHRRMWVLALVVIAGCGSPEEAEPEVIDPKEVFPDPEWAEGDPVEHGFDAAALEAVADFAGEKHSHCLLVVRHGVLVSETYYGDFGPETRQEDVFSVTKSMASALVGIAQDRGDLDVEAPASTWLTDWVGGESEAVTVRQLLDNDSGRQWDFATDYIQMAAEAEDKTAFAISLPQQHAPGAQWEYNNSAIQTLDRVLALSTGQDAGELAQAALFGPLGMDASAFGRDESGNPLMFAGVSSTCRDLARFGYLYLRKGRWRDTQVISSAWIEASTSPSTTLNDAYGHMWWLNREGHWILPSTPLRQEGDGRLIPSAPESTYAAMGIQGQIVAVSPDHDLVVVRLGTIPANGDLIGDKFMAELWSRLDAAMVDEP